MYARDQVEECDTWNKLAGVKSWAGRILSRTSRNTKAWTKQFQLKTYARRFLVWQVESWLERSDQNRLPTFRSTSERVYHDSAASLGIFDAKRCTEWKQQRYLRQFGHHWPRRTRDEELFGHWVLDSQWSKIKPRSSYNALVEKTVFKSFSLLQSLNIWDVSNLSTFRSNSTGFKENQRDVLTLCLEFPDMMLLEGWSDEGFSVVPLKVLHPLQNSCQGFKVDWTHSPSFGLLYWIYEARFLAVFQIL
jgi:hypothetical protein